MDEPLEFRLLNDFQRDFPLCSAPFARLAEHLGISEAQVLAELARLRADGKISRVGAVFSPKRLGASTLAAMAVPEAELEDVAEIVNGFAGVNHNYEREHRYNLWFVLTAPTQASLEENLHAIEAATGYPLLVLPLLEAYFIDLGFALDGKPAQNSQPKAPAEPKRLAKREAIQPAEVVDEFGRALIASLQAGLPLVAQPFAALAAQLGVTEAEVLQRLQTWVASGAIKRFGVVVRHHELGFQANAMLVQDVPDALVDQIGRALAEDKAVTLCYRRPRVLPAWRYNLFCMIHGRQREEVLAHIAKLRADHGLDALPHEILFSRTRFKQIGASYA